MDRRRCGQRLYDPIYSPDWACYSADDTIVSVMSDNTHFHNSSFGCTASAVWRANGIVPTLLRQVGKQCIITSMLAIGLTACVSEQKMTAQPDVETAVTTVPTMILPPLPLPTIPPPIIPDGGEG